MPPYFILLLISGSESREEGENCVGKVVVTTYLIGYFSPQHLNWPLSETKYRLCGSLLQSGTTVLLKNLSPSTLQLSSPPLSFQLFKQISEAIRLLLSTPYLSA